MESWQKTILFLAAVDIYAFMASITGMQFIVLPLLFHSIKALLFIGMEEMIIFLQTTGYQGVISVNKS